MPKVNEMKKTIKEKIPAEIVSKIDFPKSMGKQPDEVLFLIDQMDGLLTREQCLSVMEEQGCHKDERTVAPFVEFGKKHAGKPAAERIGLFDEIETGHKAPCHINPDGTLSIYWGNKKDGKYQCVCSVIKRLYRERGGPVNVSRTFCGCCAGHVKNSYQIALGVNLKLREIVSTPLDTNGAERCDFLFEIE